MRYKRLLYIFGFEFIFCLLFTIIIKSETGNIFFLGYSKNRLLLIITNLIPTIYFLLGVFLSKKNKEAFSKYENRFKAIITSVFGALIVELSLLILLTFLCFLFLGYIFFPEESELNFYTLPYIFKLIQPFLYFYLLCLIQVKIFILATPEIEDSKINILTISIYKKMNRVYPYLIVLIISVLTLFFYYSGFANPDKSIGTNDTPSYIEASKIDLLSLDFFSSNRPATIGGFYKIFEPEGGYTLNEKAQSSENSKNSIIFQQGFDQIALWQAIISTICWCFLALTFTLFLKNPILKILGGGTLILFSVVPQISDWNHVLQSESLSISLFVLTFSVTIHWGYSIFNHPKSNNKKNILLTISLLMSLIAWVFTRDSNVYFIVGFAVLLVLLIVFPLVKNKLPRDLLVATLICVSAIYMFHNSTFNRSDRWVNPIMNNIKIFVLPFENRVEQFKTYGLPTGKDVMSLPRELSERSYIEHEELYSWLSNQGLTSYKKFLISTPVRTLLLPLEKLDEVFSVNSQPYFINREAPYTLTNLGNILNPGIPNIVAFELIILIFFFIRILKKSKSEFISIFTVFVLFYINSLLMYVATIHGDASSMPRHSLVSVFPLRLYFWLILFMISDFELFIAKKKIQAQKE